MTRTRLLALFGRESDAIAASQQLQAAGLLVVEVYSPYPVHGLSLPRGASNKSRIPAATLAGGLVGAALGLALPWWTNAVDWVLDFGGKPVLAWPAWVPVVFEMTVLFAGLSTLVAFVLDPRRPARRLQGWLPPQISDDGFALEIEVADEAAAGLASRICESFSPLEVKRSDAEIVA